MENSKISTLALVDSSLELLIRVAPMSIGRQNTPITRIKVLLLSLMCLFVPKVYSEPTENNINLCKGATVTSSSAGSSDNNIVDGNPRGEYGNYEYIESVYSSL